MYDKNPSLATVVTFTIFALTFVLLLNSNGNYIIAQSVTDNSDVNPTTVNAGGNNSDWDKFIPQNITINAGEDVTWINPMAVVEPHAVTFMKDSRMFPPLQAPFSVPNNTQFTPVVPEANVKPVILPDPSNPNNKLVILGNAMSANPVVIDSSGENVTDLPFNANYTFTGNESYLNSGWIWPEGLSPPDAPPIHLFKVTFENPGTYNYVCAIHPWMTGTIVVT